MSRVEKFRPCRTGYKTVRKQRVGLYSPSCWNRCTLFPIGEWVETGPGWIQATYGGGYTAGFHVFHTKKAAQEWLDDFDEVLVRVQVKEPVATGLDGVMGEARVTVAKQIKILEEVQVAT